MEPSPVKTSDARLVEVGARAPASAGRWKDVRRRLTRVVTVAIEFGVPVLLLLAFLGPTIIKDPFNLQVLTIAFLNAAVVAPLVLSLGYAGLLNLSQGTFYGLGAYATAILVT